jgi:hypothetical protein
MGDNLMSQSLVSIIVVTFNNESVITACLEALSKQSYQKYEVIVVDNCSQDATLDMVEAFSYVHLIRSKNNSGFTGGNILGLQQAQGEFIVLLNPDTEVSLTWLEELVNSMRSNPNIGLCASNLLVFGSNITDSAGDGCTTTGRGFKCNEGERQQYGQNTYVFGACGGAVMLRRKLIDEIGFLDDDFFLIHEDTDLNFRARLAGWACLFVPKAIVYHKVRSSIGHMSNIAVYYSIRNARFVWVKNMPSALLLKYFHHHVIQELGAFIFFCVKHHKWSAYWQANVDFFKMLPKMLKKRREIKLLKKITNAELEKMLTPVFEYDFLKSKLQKLLQQGKE